MLTNIFPNVKSPYVQTVTDIPSVLNLIKTGFTKETISEGRLYGKGHPVFEKIKTETPTFSPNGCFNKKRATDNILFLTGFIYLDLDGMNDTEIIRQQPFVYSYWKSFSGTGLGVLVSVSGLTVESFTDSWKYLNDYFHPLGIIVDPHSKDISRQCIISYDPDIYINPEPIPLIIPYPVVAISTNISSSTFPLKYFSTCTGSEKIKYKTVLDNYHGQDYIVIEDGKEFRNSYLPKEIHSGDRHKWLTSFTSTILFNNPTISSERLVREILRANTNHCNPILSVEEVNSIVRWTFNKHINHNLNIRIKKKKIWINPDARLSTQEKRSIVGKETSKLKKQRTLNELVELYLQLKQTNQKVTQKLLQTHSTISIRTIKRYWKEIMEKVSRVNKEKKKEYMHTDDTFLTIQDNDKNDRNINIDTGF